MIKVLILLLFPLAAFGQKGYTIVFLNKKADAAEVDKETTKRLMEGHMANINRLASEGKLLAAGPFHGGGGIFILDTSSSEEAKAWVATDPAVQANRWNLEYLSYFPRTGSVCPVKEPYEMVSYTFIRFNAIVEKFTASSYPSLVRQHDAFLKEHTDPENVVTEATFGPNEGGILILREEAQPGTFSKDPAVQQGLITIDEKKLYIAKGSFCE